MSAPHSNDDRLTSLELLFTHLQRDVETLSTAVLEHQQQLDVLRKLLEKFDRRFDSIAEPTEPFDPAAERPPHY